MLRAALLVAVALLLPSTASAAPLGPEEALPAAEVYVASGGMCEGSRTNGTRLEPSDCSSAEGGSEYVGLQALGEVGASAAGVQVCARYDESGVHAGARCDSGGIDPSVCRYVERLSDRPVCGETS